MDSSRFDGLTKAFAEGRSRRDVIKKLAGGGLAAALAVVGLAAVDVEEADAAGCRSRCRHKYTGARRRRCLKRCTRTQNNTTNGVTINVGGLTVGQSVGVCTPTTALLCQSGSCSTSTNNCTACDQNRLCGQDDNLAGLVCCVEGFVCADLGCVLA
jgi:hypothetical protein